MLAIIKARYSKGTLIPLEPVALREGEEVTLSIENAHPADASLGSMHDVAGAWKGTHDPEKLLENIYPDRPLDSRAETHI